MGSMSTKNNRDNEKYYAIHVKFNLIIFYTDGVHFNIQHGQTKNCSRKIENPLVQMDGLRVKTSYTWISLSNTII